MAGARPGKPYMASKRPPGAKQPKGATASSAKPEAAEDAPKAAVGRPSTYTIEIGLAICERMAAGEILGDILKCEGMPARNTFWRWTQAHPQLWTAYSHARELLADALGEAVLTISDDRTGDVTTDEHGNEVVDWTTVQRSRLMADSRKWFVAKISPRWRDKTGVEVSNEPGRPFEVSASMPMTHPQVAAAIGNMLTEAEIEVGLPLVAEAISNSERLKRILDSGKPVPPALYNAMTTQAKAKE